MQALAWAVGLLAVAALLGACSAQALTGGAPTGSAPTGGAPTAGVSATAAAHVTSGGSGDWAHVLQVVANLKAEPPAEPTVLLLGGSAARESLIDDAGWAAQVRDLGGPSVAAYDLGSRNRTLAQDVALIKALPQLTGIVYIGINVGRFTAPPSHPTLALPDPTQSLPPYDQHQYSQSRILSVAKKQAMLTQWLTKRYAAFKKNYSSNLKTLGLLLDACKARGLHAVLLDLPRNTAIIGHALDAPVARYTSSCRALAKKTGVTWVSFVTPAHLPNADFYDLWHLVEPGRIVWQQRLSTDTVARLHDSGLGGATP